MPAKPRVVGASGGDVEEQANGAVLIHLGSQEERRLALRHLLEQVAVLGVPGGQGRQVLRELQQQLQRLRAGDGAEVPGDLLQAGIERAGRHGFSPRVMGTRTVFPHSVHDPS
jgi:hypothetical protein